MVNKVAILRFLIIALLSVVSVTSYAYDHTPKNCCNYLARPSGIKIQPFLESCFATGETARGAIPYFDCQSYVLGVIDASRNVKSSASKSRGLCLPSEITTKDVIDLIWDKYPNWDVPAHRKASAVILEVLGEKYPCKK